MKKLILHVGHGKTGSSYLQSIFALNRTLLEENDITYPTHIADKKALKGFITAGNANQQDLTHDFSFNTNTLFLSNEGLYTDLIYFRKKELEFLSKNYDLEVVAYIRNPIEYFVSKWGQAVKRDGLFQDIDSYLCSEEHGLNIEIYTRGLSRWLENSNQFDFTLKIRNYSYCKDNIVEDFFTYFLNMDHVVKDLTYPKIKTINRGLSNSEYEIQRLLNVLYGQDNTKFFSDFLITRFPEIEPLDLKISQSTYDYIVKGKEYLIEEINNYIDEDQKLIIDKAEDCVAQNNNLDTKVIMALGSFIKGKTGI